MRTHRLARVLLAGLLAWAGAALGADSLFLVSKKDMPDPNFHDAVLLVTRIEGSTIGIILNRPTRLTLGAAFSDFEKNVRAEEKLHFGGPVSLELVTFVFKAKTRPEEATEVADGVYLASDPDLLQGILAGDVKVDALRVFAGYAGWAPGQLESEVSRGDWHPLRLDPGAIFDPNPQKLWQEMDRRASRVDVRFQPDR